MSDFGLLHVSLDWGWVALPHPEDMPGGSVLHVLPVADVGAHAFDHACRCRPTVAPDGGDGIMRWCHNAFDGREWYEQGLRKPH